MNCTDANCPAYAKCLAEHHGSLCKAIRATYGLSDTAKPTNADHIRAMTDEELAEKLCKLQRYGDCPDGDDEALCEKDDCQKCWLDWLKEEAT